MSAATGAAGGARDASPLSDRSASLFVFLAAFFCVNAVLAEFMAGSG